MPRIATGYLNDSLPQFLKKRETADSLKKAPEAGHTGGHDDEYLDIIGFKQYLHVKYPCQVRSGAVH